MLLVGRHGLPVEVEFPWLAYLDATLFVRRLVDGQNPRDYRWSTFARRLSIHARQNFDARMTFMRLFPTGSRV